MLPGELSPRAREGAARLGSRMPFAQAAEELAFFWGVAVSADTVRRVTEAAGAAYVGVQAHERERIARELPPTPAGPAVQQVSMDGAMVPLVGGEWAEVKTVAIGTVAREPGASGAPEARTRELSYFSRMAEAAAFGQGAGVEFERRGTQTAGTVVAVHDGATWIQGIVDTYRPDAVRILDFPHAAEHLNHAAQAVYGAGTPEAAAWFAAQRHALRHEAPEPVFEALRALPAHAAADPAAAARVREEVLGYLQTRRDQLRYAAFAARGYPVGSGAVESACKLVVEARMKGSGMRWARPNVNPMVALRTAICGHRWPEAWPQIDAHLRRAAAAVRRARHLRRHPPLPVPAPSPARPDRARPRAAARPLRAQEHEQTRAPRVVDGRPTRDHPWKRFPACRPRAHRGAS